LQLEAPLLDRAKTKMSQLAHQDSSTLSKTKFVEESISVLLKSRHILQFSYIFGYYLEEGAAIKKMVFELLQVQSIITPVVSSIWIALPMTRHFVIVLHMRVIIIFSQVVMCEACSAFSEELICTWSFCCCCRPG